GLECCRRGGDRDDTRDGELAVTGQCPVVGDDAGVSQDLGTGVRLGESHLLLDHQQGCALSLEWSLVDAVVILVDEGLKRPLLEWSPGAGLAGDAHFTGLALTGT